MKIKNLNLTSNIENICLDLKYFEYHEMKITCQGIVKQENNQISITIISKESFNCEVILTLSEEKNFIINYKNKQIYFEGILKYSPAENKYTLHNIQVIEYENIVAEVSSELLGKSLLDRVNYIIELLGFNSEKLLPIEKITYLLRLVPLVEPLTLYVEVGPPSIGKTHIYKKLNQKINSSHLTKAKVIRNDASKEDGEFLTAKSAYIIDEFQKTLTKELITFFQLYFGEGENSTQIQISNTDIRIMDTSLLLCGNLVNSSYCSYRSIFKERMNIFKNTSISSEDNGEAFIKRINILNISNGSRKFQKDFLKTNELDSESYSFFIQSYCEELRKTKIDLNSIWKCLMIDINKIETRIALSISKCFEGILKLIYPELINKNDEEDYLNSIHEELFCLFDRALERVKAARNMLKFIIDDINDEEEEIENLIYCDKRNLLLNVRENYYMAPHRAICVRNNKVIKIPLDSIGIEQNKDEKFLLEECEMRRTEFNFDSETGILTHSKRINSNYIYEEFDFNINKNYADDLCFNYSTGEYEVLSKNSNRYIEKYTFYDLIEK